MEYVTSIALNLCITYGKCRGEKGIPFSRADQRLLLHVIVTSVCAGGLLMPLKQALVFINSEEVENIPLLPQAHSPRP